MTPQNNWEETFEKEWTGEHYFGEPGDETWPSKIELKDFIRSVEEKARESGYEQGRKDGPLQSCIECGEVVEAYESVKNCHSNCRLEL